MSPEEPQVEAGREQLLDRLQNLRAILPLFAEELANARRQSARLRVENGELLDQVRRLQRRRDGANRAQERANAAELTSRARAMPVMKAG